MEAVVEKNVKELLTESLENSMTSQEYSDLLQSFAKEEKTTGPNQNEDLIYYTKLNDRRSSRITKTLKLEEGVAEKIKSISKKQTWVLITESWCGDAANSVPVISALADMNENIDLGLILRDSNLELMDQFLTNGGRSIPKLIAFDESGEVLFTWGPRPAEAQKLYQDWKGSQHIPYKEFQIELQKWYNADKGKSLQEELRKLI